MSLPSPATPEQVESTRAWVRDFYNNLNSSDIENCLNQYFQSDAILNVGNTLSAKGHEEITSNFEKQRANFSNVNHELVHVDVFADRIYIQLKDILVVKNDPEQKEIILKVVAVIWKNIDEGKLSSMDIYLDSTPVIERIKILAAE